VKQTRLLDRCRAVLFAWMDAEAGRFILFVPVFMAGGVVAYFAWPDEPQPWVAALMAAILLAAGSAARRWPVARAGLLCAGFAALGFAAAAHRTASAASWEALPRQAVVVRGVAVSVEELPEARRVTVAAPSLDGGAPMARAVRIRLRDGDETVVAPGDTISVRALLRAPAAPGYPGGWDTQREAYFAGLDGYGFAIDPVTRLAAARAGGWDWMRAKIAGRIMAALPGARGAIAATLLTGMGAAVTAADRAAFQASGLAHLLAVAGLHLGIVMGLVFGLCRRGLALSEHAALFWPIRAVASVAALLAGLGYLLLTGAHVPTLRSFVMAGVVTLALLTGRRTVALRALALAAVVLMLAAPELVIGVGFQMSFAAVLALIAGWEALQPVAARLREAGHGVWLHGAGLLATSALAGTASLPVAAYHFGTATSYYVPANLVAVPLTALWVLPWGMAALALMPAGLEHWALTPMGWGVSGLLRVAHAVAAWPDARVAVPQIPPAALLLAMAGLIWLCLWRTRLRLAGVAGLAAGLAVAVTAPLPDLVVSQDARMVGVRVGAHVYASLAPGVSRFDRETPLRVWGQPAVALPAGAAEDGALRCDALACRAVLRGQAAMLLLGAKACGEAAVTVAHGWAACSGPAVVDRARTDLEGAMAIWLTPAGVMVRSDRDMRGARPWVIREGAMRAPVGLTAAQTE
jgi:competence protein ComEC